MKTYRFFTAILMIALCFNFVSCGDDDENGGGETNASSKRIIQIDIEDNRYEVVTIAHVNFKYQDGKVVKASYVEDGDTEKDEYSFDGDKIIVHNWTAMGNLICPIGENGWINSLYYESQKDKADFYYYSKEGYLVSAYLEGSDFEFIYDSNWNLIKPEWGISDNISYSDIPNKSGLFLVYDDDPIQDLLPMLSQAGYLGKPSTNLPKLCTWNDDDETISFDYELDNDGYVKKVTATYTEEDGTDHVWTQVYTYEEVK